MPRCLFDCPEFVEIYLDGWSSVNFTFCVPWSCIPMAGGSFPGIKEGASGVNLLTRIWSSVRSIRTCGTFFRGTASGRLTN